jgi:hypothetical protein
MPARNNRGTVTIRDAYSRCYVALAAYACAVTSHNIEEVVQAMFSVEGSLRLPTAAARVRVQVRSCGICGGESGAGTGFLRVLRLPLPILIPPNAPYSSVISGRRTKWTVSLQSHEIKENVKARSS